MGNKQSESTVSKPSKEELTKCCEKVETLVELLTHYSDCDTNNMESRQTNLVIFSFGVENSSNESCNCNCSGFWGILEILMQTGFHKYKVLSLQTRRFQTSHFTKIQEFLNNIYNKAQTYLSS